MLRTVLPLSLLFWPLAVDTPASTPASAAVTGILTSFRNGIEIYPPRGMVTIDVEPIWTESTPPPESTRERSMTLRVSLHREEENTSDRQGDLENSANLVSALRRHSEPLKRDPIFEQELSVAVDRSGKVIPVVFFAPLEEGVYKVSVSLFSKEEQSGGSLWSLPANPLQRNSTRPPVTASCQCVVFDTNLPAQSKEAGVQGMNRELLETIDPTRFDGTSEVPGKIWGAIPHFPKVANLPAQKISEITKFPGFRDRPSNAAPFGRKTESEGQSEKIAYPFSADPLLEEFSSQWNPGKSTPFGSKFFQAKHTNAVRSDNNETTGRETPTETTANTVDYSLLTASGTHDTHSWQGIPLTIRQTGVPHILEIDYPAEIAQTLRIGIYDRMTLKNGDVIAPSLRSELLVVAPLISAVSGEMATYRALFWPRTKQPCLLLTNGAEDCDARFGTIRVYRLGKDPMGNDFSGMTACSHNVLGVGERRVAGFVGLPTYANLYALPRAPNALYDDWKSIFDGSCRFIQMLQFAGYEGAMLNVASSEGILYESTKLIPESSQSVRLLPSIDWKELNARPEIQATTDTAKQEKVKNALELLLRMFDRQHWTMIPAIDFNMPLRQVEDLLKENSEWAEELFVLDVLGQPMKLENTRGVIGKRYNLLHPIVQDAMFQAVQELAQKGAEHSSFGGVAILLSPEGYAQLLDPLQGLDDRTIRQFQTETETMLPPSIAATAVNISPQRFAARAHHFRTNPADAEAWLRWRTIKVRNFYAKLAKMVQETRPEARLYLAGTKMLDHPDVRPFCRPNLVQRSTLPYALRMLGFDLSMISDVPSLVFLRPERVAASENSEENLNYAEFRSEDVGSLLGNKTGVIFVRNGRYCETTVPAGDRNRQRFIRQLASADMLLFFDGGDIFSSGGEEHLADFLATYRRLPAIPFHTYVQKTGSPRGAREGTETSEDASLQPLTVRYAKTEDGVIVYLLNDAPFEIRADLTFSATTDVVLVELSKRRHLAPTTRTDSVHVLPVQLAAYDLLAFRIEDPKANITHVHVYRPESICGPTGLLRREVDRLGRLLDEARRGGVPWDRLENSGCELDATRPDITVGWECFGDDSFSICFDTTRKYSGESSLCLNFQTKQGTVPSVGSVFSYAFQPPPTGRLFTSLVVGIPQDANALPLNVVLSAKYREGLSRNDISPEKTARNTGFYRSYQVEPILLPLLKDTVPVQGVRWQRIVVPFDQLPSEQLEEIRLGFEMQGPAMVWVDDINLYHVAFTREEINRLYRIVVAANLRCSTDRISDLLTILEGYWARLLFQNVPEPQTQMTPARLTPVPAIVNKGYAEKAAPVQNQQKPVPAQNSPKKETPSMLERVKSWFGR